MTLLARISYASNASRRLSQSMRAFRRCDSSAEIAFASYVECRKFLYGTLSNIDLKKPSVVIRRNITSSHVLRLVGKSSKKTGNPKKQQSSGSPEDSTQGSSERMDHDCKKVTKLLLAQPTSAPIGKARGPHEIKSCSSIRTGERCMTPVSTCKFKGSSYGDNVYDVDHTQLQQNEKNYKAFPAKITARNTEADFIRDMIALSSAYITSSTSWCTSDKVGDDSEYIPPFFYILPKLREHGKKSENSKVQVVGIHDSTSLSEGHATEYSINVSASGNDMQSQGVDLKTGLQGKKNVSKNQEAMEDYMKKKDKENQAIETNPLDAIPILGTTVTPSMRSDKTPPPRRIDCGIQIPDAEKGEDQKKIKETSKETIGTKKESKDANSCKSSSPASPKCEDGKKLQTEAKANGEKDSSKPVDGEDKEQKPVDKGPHNDESKYRTDGNDKEKSKSQDPSKKNFKFQIDCSKYKTDRKGTEESKESGTLQKDGGLRSTIDCSSKYKMETNGEGDLKEKDVSQKDQSKDISPGTAIDCSKYKTEAKGEDKPKLKEAELSEKVESSTERFPSDTKTPQAQASEKGKSKNDKSNKSQAPTIKGCGGATLESGETSIDCRAIRAEKKDAKAGDSKAGDSKAGDSKAGDSKAGDSKAGDSKASDSKTSSGYEKSDEGQTGSDGEKKAKIDCSKYTTKDATAQDRTKKEDGDKSDLGKAAFERTDSKEVKIESNELKPLRLGTKVVDPATIDNSKFIKNDKPKSDEGTLSLSSKSGSGDSNKGFSIGKGVGAAQKSSSDSKSTSKSHPVSSKTPSETSTFIPKSKDCRPVVCTKNIKKQNKSEPPKVDPPKVNPAKRIKLEEAPKAFNCCLKITAPEKVAIENCPMPELHNDDVIIRMNRLGICASDVFIYNQGMQKVGVNDISLGHEGAGVIVEVGSMVKHLKRGDAVVIESGVPCGHCKFCRSGRYNICPKMKFTGLLSTYVGHPAKFCHKVKKSTKLEKAALAHPLSLALHSCKKGGVSVGSKVLILGACPRGLSTVIAARAMGADKVAIIDTLERNLKVASELCADVSILADAKLSGFQLAEKALAEMKSRPNVVIDCCGCSKTIKLAVNAVEQGGHCVLAGCQTECADFPILSALAKEIKYKTSFRLANMLPRALNLIETGRANVEKMITHRVEFCEAQNAFHCASKEDESGAIKVMIEWPKEKEGDESGMSKQEKKDKDKN